MYPHIGIEPGFDDVYDDTDPDDDCRTHSLDCECEDCMQTYPERFYIDEDGTWENIHTSPEEESDKCRQVRTR